MKDRGWRTGGVVAVLAVLAAGLTTLQVTRPGLLLGATPDVSVYLGAAVRLVHGAAPYRDYVFVQPPGFVLLAAPIGFLADAVGTRDALGVLRLLTPLLAATSVLLVGSLVRHRGVAATAVACTVMACFPAELYAIRGPQLEPIVNLLVLIGAAVIFEAGGVTPRRRLISGGLVLGLAVAIKLSAAIPVAVLLVVCAGVTRRRFGALIAATVAGFATVTLPFAALAPASFWQDAVITQLGRVPAGDRATLVTRLGEMTGLSEIRAAPAVIIAVSALVVAAVATVFLASRRRPTSLEWFALGATAAVALAQLAPAQYYTQYAALLAPFVSLVLGLGAGRLAGMLHRPRAVLVAALTASGALLAAQVAYVRTEWAPDLAAVVDAAVPAGACALSDRPVLLFTADRFQSTVAGCTELTDPAGTLLALGGDRRQSADTWQQAFEHVDYVVTDRPIRSWQLPTAARIPDYVDAHFRLVHAQALLVYVRSA